MIGILTTPAIAGIALLWALKVCSNTLFFLQIYVRFVPDPMGSDAKNTLHMTLASKKCHLIALTISARLMHHYPDLFYCFTLVILEEFHPLPVIYYPSLLLFS